MSPCSNESPSHSQHHDDDDEQERAHKRSRILDPASLPPLEELLSPMNEEVDWQAVLARLDAYPQEASTKIQTGPDTQEYPLIAALNHEEALPLQVVNRMLECFPDVTKIKGAEGQHRAVDMAMRCTQEVVDAIIKANPNAVREKWINGNVQLHYADNVTNAEIARLLIKEYPGSMQVVGAYGDLPLHWAVEYENLPVVEVILEESIQGHVDMPDGSSLLSVKNDKDLTPLDVACQMFVEIFKDEDEDDDVFTDVEDDVEQDANDHDLEEDDYEEPDHSREAWRNQRIGRYHKKRWKIVTALARASFLTGPYRNQNVDFSILHSLMHRACHPDAIWFALRTNNRLLQAKNSNGDTPLLIAASNRSVQGEVIDMLLTSEHGWAEAASITDRQGRLPLHVAALSGRKFEEGIQTIIEAEPRALQTRDLNTAMYPFMLCAHGGGDLSTVYRLVREVPSVLQHYHP